jgi:hypothetical protein
MSQVDHLVHGVPDLDVAVDELERRTGVRAAPGGHHVGRGTWNALAGLDDGAYLELIAPDPSQDVDAERLEEEQLLAWLSTVNDLRLILGTRLGVTDDNQDEHLPDEDPRAQGYALYHYLGFLEEQIVEALAEALPEG